MTHTHITGADLQLIWDAEYAIPSSLEVDFRNSNLESRTDLMPVQGLNDILTTSPYKQERETGTGSRKHLRDKNFLEEILEEQKLHGELRSFLVTCTSLGVTRILFGLYRLQKTL